MGGADMNEGGGGLSRAETVVGIVLWVAVVVLAFVVGMLSCRAAEPFEPARTEYRGHQVRMEFEVFAPGVCAIKTWVGGLQVTPDVEWVYETHRTAGGTLVRYDYCVRMARGEEQ